MAKFFSYRKLGKNGKTAFWVILFFVAAIIHAAVNPPKQRLSLVESQQLEVDKEKEDINTAKYYCREMIEKSLNDRDSIQYANKYAALDYAEVERRAKGNVDLIVVQTELRARNAYGAYVRKIAKCDYAYTKNGELTPLGLKGL